MIVSPITEPMESLTGDPAPLGTIRQEMYVPKGPWVDTLNGDFPVGQVASIYGIRDVPGTRCVGPCFLFVRGWGSLTIPLKPKRVPCIFRSRCRA